jgi:hypothetical protein
VPGFWRGIFYNASIRQPVFRSGCKAPLREVEFDGLLDLNGCVCAAKIGNFPELVFYSSDGVLIRAPVCF